jgi:predicted nucleic acid-binding Zn ribbon protein
MEKRYCLECGDALKGRSDQKFCNDLCRNAYNNKRVSTSSNLMRKINRILKKNHSILLELNPEEKTTTLKTFLDKREFDFGYYTHTFTTKTGRVYYFCYDQGYAELENGKYLLVKSRVQE